MDFQLPLLIHLYIRKACSCAARASCAHVAGRAKLDNYIKGVRSRARKFLYGDLGEEESGEVLKLKPWRLT